MFYILQFDEKYSINHYLDWLNQNECDFKFDDENPWLNHEGFEVLLSLQENQSDRLSDFFFCGTLMVVSDRLKLVLESYSERLEFVSTLIMCGEKEFKYYTLHIMEHIEAMDVDSSDYEAIKYGMIAGITNLVLDETLIKSSSIFALKNTFTPICIISEKIRSEISDFEGLKLIPSNEYQEDIRGI